MKTQKFKIERNKLEEVDKLLTSMRMRGKLVLTELLNNCPSDDRSFRLANLYINTIDKFSAEAKELLEQSGKEFLVAKNTIETFSQNKKILEEIETSFARITGYSIRVH